MISQLIKGLAFLSIIGNAVCNYKQKKENHPIPNLDTNSLNLDTYNNWNELTFALSNFSQKK